MKKNPKSNTLLSYLIFILFVAIIGFLAVLLALKLTGNNSFIKSDFPCLFLNLALVAIYLQITIHEVGHLLCGLASGYKFVSFRIASFTIVKRGEKYKLKRFKVPGTGGQCLMMPPEQTNGNYPYKLYNAGGILFNTSFSLITILCLFLFHLPTILFIFLLIFSIFGILFALLNGIPMKIYGIANDGYNIKSLDKDEISRWIFHLQLKINGLQTDGLRLKDMPEEWFKVPENIDMKNSMHLSLFLFICARYMDELNFEKARQCLEDIEPYADNLIGLYRKERICELLFFEIIGECRQEVINELYSNDIKSYIKQFNRYMFSKKRILYAYILTVEKNSKKAEKIFSEALRMQETYPSIGDAESELVIIEYVRKRYL